MSIQEQGFCHRCNRHTLHTRSAEPINHALHLVVVLFCWGIWLPFYLLLLVLPNRQPWLCTRCGEELGYLSDEIEQVDEVEYQREVRAYHTAERARRDEEAIDLEFESEPSAIKTGLVSGAKTLLLQFATALQQPNRALTVICGDDKILLRIYQATIIAAGILIAGFVLNVVGRSAGWF